MTAVEFINKWKSSINYLGLPSVGIHVGWDIIHSESKVDNISGEEAWKRIYKCTPPWFKMPKTFQQLIDSKDSDYLQIVKEETNNGKIEYYHQNGLREPYFCAFSNKVGSFMILGDGNHRFLDCLYIMHDQKYKLNHDLSTTSLEIIYLQNFDDVIRPDIIWSDWSNFKGKL